MSISSTAFVQNSNLRPITDYSLNYGGYIYISFGVNMDINSVTFDNGIANDGGSIYLNG